MSENIAYTISRYVATIASELNQTPYNYTKMLSMLNSKRLDTIPISTVKPVHFGTVSHNCMRIVQIIVNVNEAICGKVYWYQVIHIFAQYV